MAVSSAWRMIGSNSVQNVEGTFSCEDGIKEAITARQLELADCYDIKMERGGHWDSAESAVDNSPQREKDPSADFMEANKICYNLYKGEI